jgi:hypothetical protein
MSPQQIWQSHALDAPRVTLEDVRRRTDDLAGNNRAKLMRLFILQLLLSAFLLFHTLPEQAGRPFMQTLLVLSIAGTWVWLVWWKRRMAPAPADAQASVLDSVRYYRAELTRQRDLHRKNWRYGLLINAVAMPFLALVYAYEAHESWPFILTMMGVPGGTDARRDRQYGAHPPTAAEGNRHARPAVLKRMREKPRAHKPLIERPKYPRCATAIP